MRLRCLRLAGLLLLLVLASPVRADILVLANGRHLTGGVHRDEGDSVAFNPYFSRHPGMVFDVEVYPRSAVREIVREDPLFVTYMKKSLAIADGDADARVELARWCDEKKLDDEARRELLRALRIDPDHEAALKEFGRSKFRRAIRGNPDFHPEIRAAIEEYLAIPDPEEREKAFRRLEREHSVDLPREYLDRIVRSLGEPTGLQVDRELTLRATESPGLYTLFVPKEYDPRRPWPLIIGLHGGGPGGKDRDAVVGSGDSAMNFYVRQAAARGYIVACPNALAAPWAAPANEPLVRSVLEEVELLYHVDLNRVYLTGHSMGGFGTWYFGPKMAEEFAAISPMAGGGGGGGVSTLASTNTPVFVYHGADDGVVGPDSDRAAARQLVNTGLDFVYTELDGVGHGFPESIQKDLFDFFDVRRLARMRGRRAGPPSAEVRSSFLGKVSRDEERYLGDPLEFAGAGAPVEADWKDLVKDLELGGGKAEAAADRLGELEDEDSVKPISDLLRNPGTSDDVKRHAARALGLIGHEDGYRGLAAGLESENPEVIGECARSMAKIGAKKAGEALVAALAHLAKSIDGKRIGENRIHMSDWERWLDAFAAAVEGVGALGVENGTGAIRNTAVRRVLAAGFDVIYSQRAGQDPRVPTRKLAVACVKAVAALDEEEKADVLEEIRKSCPDDAAVAAAIEAAQ